MVLMEPEKPEDASKPQYGEQDENGIDLSLIRRNLKLTPEERLIRGDKARRNFFLLREYGQRYREERSRQDR
jgi:hypothetical protein